MILSDTRLIITDSITKISRSEWEQLTTADVFGQFDWLHTAEISIRGARRAKYFLLYRNQKLIAAAVGYRLSRGDELSRLDDLLFGDSAALATRLRLTPNQSLYFGPLVGHGRHVFWNRNCHADEVDERIYLLLKQITTHKDFAGVTIAFGRIPASEARLLAALRRLGFLESKSWPISYLNIRWNNFEDYVSSLSRRGKNLPTKIRRELAAPEKIGIVIKRSTDFGTKAENICHLFDENHRKHSSAVSEFKPDFIEALAKHHASGSVITIAKADGEPQMLGCALLLTAEGTASGPLVGIAKHESNRVAFTYFNLAFYAPIRYCIENGIRNLYFGAGLRHMKRKRGCDEMDTYVFMRPATRVGYLFWRVWFVFHCYWIQRKTRSDAD